MPMRMAGSLADRGAGGHPGHRSESPATIGRRLADPLPSGAMGLLDGKKIVVTGVLTDSSIAYSVARIAIEEGADVVLTGAGRALSLTQRTARKLPGGATIPVFELDVTVPEHLGAVRDQVARHWGRVDGVLHSIGFAPQSLLGDDFMGATWDDVAIALQISTYSLKALADAFVPLMPDGGAFVGLDFDNSVTFPAYNWMGVAKSALQSLSRYLARELGPQGIRFNLVAAGPVRTMAAKSIPGFSLFEDIWDARAPLGWDIDDPEPVGKACVALLSDWFPATTGEIVHVDGGFHSTGAAGSPAATVADTDAPAD
jgi:enoyl-[acyl-carrier protein] reductase I